jgi:S1-C subfamily serine protease
VKTLGFDELAAPIVAGKTGYDEGLRPDDFITGVDGIRVRNSQQYRAVRDASSAERMRLTVWRQGQPLEVSARLRYRWVVSSTKTYETGKSTK